MPSLLDEFAGKVDLIYIDPPFATGADFSYLAQVGDENFTKQANTIEQKAYRDTWGRGLDGYYDWFYETVVRLHGLLSESGSLWVHCDWHVNSGVRLILDEVFGSNNALNQITWKRIYTHSDAKRFGVVDDTIFFYSKSEHYVFNKQYKPHSDSYIKSHYGQVDENGERYRFISLSAAGTGPPRKFGDRIIAPPPGTHWKWSQERIDDGLATGKIAFSSRGKPHIKRYLNESQGNVIHSIWDDIYPVNPAATERVGYPTQKPEALLHRIIEASTDDGDLVLDCFCGSGTTAAASEKLNRRWIACDLGRFAIHTTRKRLLGIENVRPFVVQNLGKYERQVWQKAEFGENAATVTRTYRKFILDLYHAEMVEAYTWLHGKKGRRMVHVGSVDSPVAVGDVRNIAIDFRRAIGSGKKCPRRRRCRYPGLGFCLGYERNGRADRSGSRYKCALRTDSARGAGKESG